MALSHVKSVTIGDFTGTVTAFGSNGSTATVAATDLVRPGDWNSAHNQYVTLTGNTAGHSAISGTNIVLAGGTNVTLSATTGAGAATISVVGQDVSQFLTTAAQSYKVHWVESPWAGPTAELITNVTALTNRPILLPFEVGGYMSADELMWPMSRSTSGSNAFTVDIGVYSYANTTSIGRIASGQTVYSATDTGSISGIRLFEFPMSLVTTALTPGQYVLAMRFEASATASMNYSLMGGTTANPVVGGIHAGSNTYWTHTSHQQIPLWGRFSTTTASLPAGFAASDVIGAPTGASAPLPVAFTIASDY
jgi:hypothetical protein